MTFACPLDAFFSLTFLDLWYRYSATSSSLHHTYFRARILQGHVFSSFFHSHTSSRDVRIHLHFHHYCHSHLTLHSPLPLYNLAWIRIHYTQRCSPAIPVLILLTRLYCCSTLQSTRFYELPRLLFPMCWVCLALVNYHPSPASFSI